MVRKLIRRLWLALAVVIIGVAAIAVVGRQLVPHLDTFRADITGYFSRHLGVAISATELSGEWPRLTPKLSARGIAIAMPDRPQEPALSIDRATAELDFIASLRVGEPVWRELSIGRVELTAVEAAGGGWVVGGIAIGGAPAAPGRLGQLLGALLLSRLIEVDQVVVHLRFQSGATTRLFVNQLRAENSGDFHRLRAALAMGTGADVASLVIEGRGDPRAPTEFNGNGYLRMQRVNFSGPITELARLWVPELVARVGEIDTAVDAELWLGAGTAGLDWRGHLHAAEIPLSWAQDLPPVKNLSAEITGWWRPGTAWALQLQGLDFDWADVAIAPLNVQVGQREGTAPGDVALAADHLDLAALGTLLLNTGLAGSKLAEVVGTLKPRGTLRDLHLELTRAAPQPVRLRARLDRLAVEPWHGAPGARNLSGYLDIQGYQGFFELDSPDGFAMLYPQAYRDYMPYGSAQGRVNLRWDPAAAVFSLASGRIRVVGEEGNINAYLYLHMPTLDNADEPEMYLLAGIQGSHSRFLDRYLPQTLDAELLGWLDRAIGAMDITDAAFVWRGSLRGANHSGRSIQVGARIANGAVDYYPGWPALSGVAANLVVDDVAVHAEVGPAEAGGAHLVAARVDTRGEGENLVLSVQAEVTSSLAEGVAILARSPLHERVAMMKDWRYQGEVATKLDLAIPLAKNRQGEHYRVAAVLKGAQAALGDDGLAFTDIAGTLNYDDRRGLYADTLSARLWGQTLAARIDSREGATQITAQGLLKVAELPVWTPLQKNHLSGETPLQAVFTAPSGGAQPTLRIESDLQGIAIQLPPPLFKAAADTRALTARIDFRDDGLRARAQLGPDLAGSARFVRAPGAGIGLERAAITVGGKPAVLPATSGLSVTGHLPRFALNDWLPLFAKGSGGTFDLTALNPRFDVQLDELSIGGFALPQTTVTGRYDRRGWALRLAGPRAAGTVAVPPPQQAGPLVVDLDYVVIPKTPAGEKNDSLDKFDPRDLPDLDFRSRGVRWGDDELGEIAFSARHMPTGTHISGISGEITGMATEGTDAALDWHIDNGAHYTRFVGKLRSDDLGAVLAAWHLPVLLTSDRAAFDVDLGWAAPPWDFATELFVGSLKLDLRDGSFAQAPGVTTNAILKLVGLVNFDSWLRRLRLDFSDLFARGVNYDRLKGGMSFDRGQVAFDPAIVAILPSGKMRLLGNANLVAETIDAQLVATLPVNTNLPWIVALAGGLPAAAGVYLSGKLFKRQVDKLSSISYRVKGSLDNPDLEIERIFSDKIDDEVVPDGSRGAQKKTGGDTTP